MYYNIRGKNGRFFKPQVETPRACSVVAGRLYDYRGAVVRAGQMSNGLRLVSFHKRLYGFVQDAELGFIDKQRVDSYLEKA